MKDPYEEYRAWVRDLGRQLLETRDERDKLEAALAARDATIQAALIAINRGQHIEGWRILRDAALAQPDDEASK